jgi:hypothetical protein
MEAAPTVVVVLALLPVIVAVRRAERAAARPIAVRVDDGPRGRREARSAAGRK